ncbi:uncharacterized protein [Aristolochia californica]|uniref:uncharacterized protein n=1 Tax=Aristolochia californica TaxID=171875 RepID=UPI0035DCB146
MDHPFSVGSFSFFTKVGDICKIEPGAKRGVVKFVGQAESAASGSWVGVKIKGKWCFECSPLHGALLRPDSVKVGDYPEWVPLDEGEILKWSCHARSLKSMLLMVVVLIPMFTFVYCKYKQMQAFPAEAKDREATEVLHACRLAALSDADCVSKSFDSSGASFI